jgi:hypothetical protein
VGSGAVAPTDACADGATGRSLGAFVVGAGADDAPPSKHALPSSHTKFLRQHSSAEAYPTSQRFFACGLSLRQRFASNSG